MKILSSSQIKALDLKTIEQERISSIELMERASWAFVRQFEKIYAHQSTVHLFCGNGNNGGDGLAIGRILSTLSFNVQVYLIETSNAPSPDFSANLIAIHDHLLPHRIHDQTQFPKLDANQVCIDALLGTGLSRPVTGIAAQLIHHLNQSSCEIVAVDIASGLYVDRPNDLEDAIIKPTYTFTFQVPKLSFMFPANDVFVGKWEVLDIQLDKPTLAAIETPYLYTDPLFVKKNRKHRPKFSHKGTFGHALIMAGSYGKMGAAILASKACLRSGVGLLTMHIPGCGYEIAQISIPEAMVSVDDLFKNLSHMPELAPYHAIGIGPGIDTNLNSVEILKQLLIHAKVPLVLDADAINILAYHPDLISLLPPNTILTPHPKEFERLTKKTINEFERLETAMAFASEHKVIICLKGAHTAVILPRGAVHFNSTGNPGMSTGGTGDVLTGIITGLLAQQYAPQDAAILGVYIHGKAGDVAAAQRSESALIASDLIEALR
jgi:hydroxyethylthiazole kinase-like uncharacterized protein yjeF